jgi:hypothetical protein
VLLIVIEFPTGGKTPGVYHAIPYRIAASVDEARELMLDYLRSAHKVVEHRIGVPEFFALFNDSPSGIFDEPTYYDPTTIEIADDQKVIAWLQETGRC